MTLPIERARSRKPVTWLTLVGVLLLPAVIGGILVAALYNPTERLESMSTAIVNNDEPVTIDGQTVPLGRQLTAGLVEGSDDQPSNLDWTISNPDDARAGLDDGTYDAIITIPENFSAAATSTSQSENPVQATISVETAPDSLIVDDAITAQVTQAAASLMGEQLSIVYLENVFLGFTTLGDQLGDAADGATELAEGAAAAADGAKALPGGARQVADGAGSLGDGAAEIGGGAAQLAGGASSLGSGATALQSGLSTIAAKTRDAAAGATALAEGVDAGAAALASDGIVPADLTGVAARTEDTAKVAADAIGGVAQGLSGLSAQCAAAGGATAFCAQLAALADGADGASQAATGTHTLAGYTDDGLSQFAAQAPQQLSSQLSTIAGNVRTLAGGLGQLADGVGQSASGAGALATGASQLSGGATGIAEGANALASGAYQLSSGAGELADGADQLADGVSQLADGTGELADGLHTAVEAIPSYTDDEATDLASVLADPVAAEGVGSSIFGASAVPLLATLALWFGGLASFVALQAVPRHALSSRRPSVLLAARSLAPAAGIGALQGLLVAGVVQLAASYDLGTWMLFAGLSVVAGVAFAAVNQALVAVFGGAGRWISALVGVLAVATGVVSTVPGVLSSVAGLMPTTPAYTALLAALTPAEGVIPGVVGMLVWGGLAFVATIIAVVRRRTTSPRSVLVTAPA
ncbi:DUF3533 domain-containing protein [Microbacterium saccharophilum]|uniref:DUF3533 domain-containing protein n=1 Tax=Microbacterium saccharophilum TaxID=1213358 RepID=A0A5C8HY10_9MICO|nr:YhgE/Pip family protein [Microbacterium saccharophilum]TXK11301.1 DUF3533 domain-containing protein [Microbacterium saccharophilum]GEP48584.1 hypothetical protein MSA03_20920 [Microbacterium saccharophilum]